LRFIILILILVFLSVIFSVIPKQAYADGFTQENLQPVNIGNRKISLFVKLSPPIITSYTKQDRYLFFRWFDANTNQTIQHTTFLVSVEKHGQELYQNLYHTHTGILKLKITPSNDSSTWTTDGIDEPFLDGDMYLPKYDDTMDQVAPILGEGGLYHISIMLITIDSDQNIFPPESTPTFDSYLSVGDISNNTINYQNNNYNVALVSYYDKIANFNFDQSKLQVSWSMPFDWNTTRFQKLPIFVHEELHIPKFFKEFTSTPTFSATVNGNPIVGRDMIVDPYSVGDDDIIHLLLNKNDISNLAKSTPLGVDKMIFTVSPARANVTTSKSILTDFGGLGVNLGWSGDSLAAYTQNNLKLTFFDALTEQQVKGDVNYDFKILDTSGNVLYSQAGFVAKNGTNVQPINLPLDGIYRVEINIKSIIYNGLPDTSRIGLARGDMVIPSILSTNKSIIIPTWIKNTAKLWSNSSVSDNDFIKGLQYMNQNDIIKIPLATQNISLHNIPHWLKNNAGWWSNGQISNEEFVGGIQYLISVGIIEH
jgi:hypothetical protein